MAPDDQVSSGVGARPSYGEVPLGQTVAAAAAIRRLIEVTLSLEHEHPTVDAIVTQCEQWERELAPSVPRNPAPRFGDELGADRRIYLDHAFDVGAFNPCFPQYEFDHLDADTASGTVEFGLSYEGPPGLVHGGFLGVFFDCVVQQQNCAVRLSGKTRTMDVSYRRPTPVLTPLRFEIDRTHEGRELTSTARLLLSGTVLCGARVTAVALPPEQLTGSRHGRRRISN